MKTKTQTITIRINFGDVKEDLSRFAYFLEVKGIDYEWGKNIRGHKCINVTVPETKSNNRSLLKRRIIESSRGYTRR